MGIKKNFKMRTFAAVLMAATAFGFESQMPELILKDDYTPNYTPVTVTEDGEAKTVYIASPWWYTGGGGDNVTLPYGGRSYLSVTDYDDPEGFYKPNLLGGSIEYDMDLSQMTCGCIAA